MKITMKIRTYEVVSRAIEEGIAYGWMRAHKHTDKPGEETIKAEIENAILNSLSEVVNWEDVQG